MLKRVSDFLWSVQAWVGKVMKHLGEVSPEKQAEFKKTAPDAVKFLISKAKELQL